MIKAILFDLDGIVMIGREKYFSVRYAEEHDVPVEMVSEFFLGQFQKCSFGQCDLKEEIAPFLPKWKWEGSVEDFIRHWFTTEATLDTTVLKRIDALRAKGFKCYIASRQEKYRMAYLLDEVGLKKHFDGTFVTCEVGYDKSQKEYWEQVIGKLGLQPEEILFFDDTKKNVDMAQSMGIDAHFYDRIQVLEEQVARLI
jgi:putative hydrolase of the HAD superfamily